MNNETKNNDFPLAMDPPTEKLTFITSEIIDSAIKMSRKSPRLRIIVPFHKSDSDNLHRMLNVIQPYSYIQPHRHSNPPKAETLIVLKGSLACIVFDNEGKISKKMIISNQSNMIGVDMEPSIYHTFFALEKDTVLFEIKPGPYKKSSDKDFATWAPKENSKERKKYLESLYEHF
ncbi:MAG: cupin fold metalloprotein, WbuC family [Candidatus Electrothrix sp. AR3]|nr:cupin fold metalloprotein, WbuC family [Candidatus Electrothrix sp. AR3]